MRWKKPEYQNNGKIGSGRPKEIMMYSLATWHGGTSVSEVIGSTNMIIDDIWME